jgi:AraC-like DNA-binding protein
MMALRELLDNGGADALSLAEIAARACVSVNTLQRHFRAMWGTTVAQYLRDGRLARARLALERDGVSVMQAAELAGYNSAANFATAFRRRFGVSPGQVRARR